MNLTMQEVSKLTKLAIPTIYSYASRQKLGKKVGNRKVFSQSDVQKLLKGSKSSVSRSKPRGTAKKASKKTIKTVKIEIAAAKTPAIESAVIPVAAKPMKRSFWSRLFGGKTTSQRVPLMEMKQTK